MCMLVCYVSRKDSGLCRSVLGAYGIIPAIVPRFATCSFSCPHVRRQLCSYESPNVFNQHHV
jgi:hypothetical protein